MLSNKKALHKHDITREVSWPTWPYVTHQLQQDICCSSCVNTLQTHTGNVGVSFTGPHPELR